MYELTHSVEWNRLHVAYLVRRTMVLLSVAVGYAADRGGTPFLELLLIFVSLSRYSGAVSCVCLSVDCSQPLKLLQGFWTSSVVRNSRIRSFGN
jgi:hypothetical protein